MHPTRLTALSLTLLSCLILAGCLGTSPPSQFYMLEPLATRQANPGVQTQETLLIALAPVRVPGYVDRPQIVHATGPNAYRLDETNRWAEDLAGNIARVLTQDLAVLVPAEVVPLNGSARAREAKLKLSLNILEFHVDERGQAHLTAQWQITRPDGSGPGRQASYAAPASDRDYALMVKGLNQCLNQLDRDLAAALRQEAARPDAGQQAKKNPPEGGL